MTVSSTNSRNDYTASGACTFNYTFEVTAAASLDVYLCGALQTSGYTVSGVGATTGGTVTFTSTPAVGSAVVLIRDEPFTQDQDLVNHGPFDADALEDTQDKHRFIDQQLLEQIGRAPKFAVFSCVANIVIDDVTGCAGMVMSVAADETHLEWVSVSQAQAAATGTYTASGAGAVSRTVTAKLADWPTVAAKDYGVLGNGVADDQGALAIAVAALPSTGGVLLLPAGTIRTSSASPLLTLTDRNDVTILGMGVGTTILRNEGAGNVISATGTSEILNLHIADVEISGNSAAAIGIALTNTKEAVIERFKISGCRNHGINIAGASNLHNIVRDGRIASNNGITAGARGINAVVGANNRFHNIYFNIGGNDATHYQIALDLQGSNGAMSEGNIFDSVPTAIRTSSEFNSVGDWFDMANVTLAYQHTSNNAFVSTGSRGISSIATQCDFTGVDQKYVSFVGTIDPLGGRLAGQNLSGCGSALVVTTAPTTPTQKVVYDQSLLKAQVVFDGTNLSPITPSYAFNIRDNRVTRIGATGDYCVSFNRVFSCARYAVSGTASNTTAANGANVSLHTMNADCVRVLVFTAAGAAVDGAIVCLSFYGPQA